MSAPNAIAPLADWLSLLALGLPLLLAGLLPWPGTRRWALALAPGAALPALACALWGSEVVLQAPRLLLGLRLGLDGTGRSFLLLGALLWSIAGLAARAYHAEDAQRTRLWACWLLAMAGNLWLVLARDAAGFYAGFALMTFAAYGLVVHAQTPQAWRAGRIYLLMSLLGEALLLAGLIGRVAGLDGATDLPLAAPAGRHDGWALPLLIAGLGVKTGLPGLHLWLPLAHPVAPTPASAVLSGVMIKAGLLGWLRFLPLGAQACPELGQALLLLGLLAAFGGVLAGLCQTQAKTVLAYSSISQMGLMTVGLGAGLLQPAAWPALGAALALYALHHGLAKGALFLAVAAVPARGRGRRLALALTGLPALALAGAPLSSGALAKLLLKQPLALLPADWPQWLGWLLPLAAAGTTVLMARFLWTLARQSGQATPGMTGPWALALLASALLAPLAGPLQLGWAFCWPVLLGLSLAALAWRRPLPHPALPAGDLLAWLEGPVARLWQGLLALAARPDAPRPAAAPRPPWPWLRWEARLQRFALALGLLVWLVLALWFSLGRPGR